MIRRSTRASARADEQGRCVDNVIWCALAARRPPQASGVVRRNPAVVLAHGEIISCGEASSADRGDRAERRVDLRIRAREVAPARASELAPGDLGLAGRRRTATFAFAHEW